MAYKVADLWPADVGTTELVPPVAILRAQAAILGEKTQNLVEAQVETVVHGAQLRHLFYVVAPSLNYRYLLFEIRHDVLPYPLDAVREQMHYEVRTPEDFVGWLRDTLGSEETKRVVGSLLSQVQT